jgi:hypothetical protein
MKDTTERNAGYPEPSSSFSHTEPEFSNDILAEHLSGMWWIMHHDELPLGCVFQW